MCPSVHAQTGSPATKTVALGTELASVASFAVENSLVAVKVGRVKHLVAHTAFEALLVEGEFSNFPGLGGVYSLATPGALDLLWGFERHLDVEWWSF